MRLSFDFSPAIQGHGGIGRATEELIRALINLHTGDQFNLFYTGAPDRIPATPFDSLPRTILPQSNKLWRFRVLLSSYLNRSMDQSVGNPDLFHATDHLLPPLHARSVFTLYDLSTFTHPQVHSTFNRIYQRLMLPRFLRRADAIIAISDHTRRDAEWLLHVPSEKISVIPLGVNAAFHPVENPDRLASIRAKYRLPDRFILYLGTLEPRKNLPALLTAYHHLQTQDPATPDLVIAGRKGWLYQSIFDRVCELGLETRVHFTGFVPDEDAPTLISAASVFVYPSLYEGFGLPPLEAMACGTPVICSNASSLPEVVNDAGILIEPQNIRQLASAIQRVLTDPDLQANLRAQGLVQAKKFSWEHSALETYSVYARCLSTAAPIRT